MIPSWIANFLPYIILGFVGLMFLLGFLGITWIFYFGPKEDKNKQEPPNN